MTDFGTLLDAHTIRFERDLPGPIERVWSYLTEPDLKATWIGRGEFPQEPGAEFRWTWTGDDGEIAGEMRGRMRAYDPPHVLEYDWSEKDAPDGSIRESTVRFELTARGDRVTLVLTHRALPTESYSEVAAGWHAGLDTLVAEVGGIAGPDAYARYGALAPHYGALASFPQADAVRIERTLPVPPERVWAYLTEPDLLATWLARGRVPERVGTQFTLQLLANGEAVDATLTAYAAPRLLAYTWFVTAHETPRPDHSHVRYELTAQDGGTALVLTHAGVLPGFQGRVAAGWHGLLDGLGARIAGIEPPDFFSVFPRVIDAYEDLAG